MSTPRFMRDNYSDLFGADALPVLEELFKYELNQHPSRREAIFKVVSTENDIWQSSEIHDMPLLEQMAEGQDYNFRAPSQGYAKTLKPVKYGLGFSISEEAVDDGKFAHIADALKKLAKSAKESQEIQAMNVLNNGFSSETTADGVALFSTSHLLPGGGTMRNKLSSDADLADASLKQALVDFEKVFVGDSGIIYKMQPRALIVPSELKYVARELIGSELSTSAASVNNMNSLRDEDLTVISSPHLTDADAWFVAAAPVDTGLRIISRKPIETKAGGPDSGFMNDSILYKTRYREKVGAVHAYGILGTSGAD